MELEAIDSLLAVATDRPAELQAALDRAPEGARTFLVVTLEALLGLHATSFGGPRGGEFESGRPRPVWCVTLERV